MRLSRRRWLWLSQVPQPTCFQVRRGTCLGWHASNINSIVSIMPSNRMSLKKLSFSRLAPLEAPRLFIGLEISPKCYQTYQTYPFTHFHTIYGWFPPNYGPKYGPFKQNKFHCWYVLLSAQSASEFFIPRFSTIYMKNGSYRLIPFLFPLTFWEFLHESCFWLTIVVVYS